MAVNTEPLFRIGARTLLNERSETVAPESIPASSSAKALYFLLQTPIQFIPATSLTYADEKKMAPILRPRRRQNENIAQRHKCVNVSHISSKWERQRADPRPSQGFSNPGVLCYQNSVLQALLHIPKFVNWLEHEHVNCNLGASCVACALRTLSLRYWDKPSDKPAISAAVHRARRTLKAAGWRLHGQQDAHDFYIALITHLQSQLPHSTHTLTSLFTTTMSETLVCPHCPSRSSTLTATTSIGIPFAKAAPLPTLIGSPAVWGPETVSDVLCSSPSCAHRSNRPRHKRISTAPEILVMQIRRFTAHGKRGTFRAQVNKAHVPFSECLDLSPFIDDDDGNAPLRYRLLAVVHHSGSLHNGHYKAVAKNPSGIWEEIEDMQVRSKNVTINDATRPVGGWSPYLLFWEKVAVASPLDSHDQMFKDEKREDATRKKRRKRGPERFQQ